ncbi:MAG: Rrf2 family transcriptional regulator [Geobacter sp.]|nr:Rrf2 family transcriptional regulator [Geobacter sp.]
MMELTRKGEYAIRGVIYLAQQQPGKMVLISEIAEGADVPQMFLAKILQSFAKLGIVRSYRGTGGGFTLGRPASDITLREVVEAVEGPIVPNRCLMGNGSCDRIGGCGVHPVWQRVQEQVVHILESVTLEELAEKNSNTKEPIRGIGS